jgi:hypothetical protein
MKEWGDSDSTIATSGGGGAPMSRVRTAFKTFRNFPWSSSSEDERRNANDAPATSLRDGVPANRIVPALRQPRHRTRNPFARSRHNSPSKESTSPGFSAEGKVSEITLLNNTVPMSERVPTRHRDTDKLTRTEQEYQELLSILNELKREMRAGKEKAEGMTSLKV